MNQNRGIIVAISGASGACYGVRLVEILASLQYPVHLILTPWAIHNFSLEPILWTLEEVEKMAYRVYRHKDLGAAIASGSYLVEAMVIAPCSMKTLASIACGFSDNLVTRAADVTLKERRKLILVPRETPLNDIHLTNMLNLSKAGAIVLPPMPAFYHQPQSIQDIIDHTVGKILDQLHIEHSLMNRWQGLS